MRLPTSQEISRDTKAGVSRRRFLRLAGSGLGIAGIAACSSSSSDNNSGNPNETDGDTSQVVGFPEPVPSEFIWSDARMILTTTEIEPEDFDDQIPPGLKLAEPNRATFFVAHYPLTNFDSVYNEAAVLLHVEHDDGTTGWHCSWMVVDDDTALILGRELLGFPKKLADISYQELEDGRVEGVVTRRGEEVMRIEASLEEFEDEAGAVWAGQPIINAFGSVVSGMKLLKIGPLEENVDQRQVGPAKVSLGTTDRDPLGKLNPKESAEGVWAIADFAEFTPSPFVGDIPADWALAQMLARAQ